MNGSVKREELLAELNSVRGGLTTKEIIEQSSCLVFRGGKVMTYNDEVACTNTCQLEVEGAVIAAPLLAILEKRKDETLTYEVADGRLKLKGKNGATTGVRMEAQIALPFDNVEMPDKDSWRKMAPDFEEAVSLVQECAGKDESRFSLTCIHIHPKWIESCDNWQVMRYRIATGLEQSILIRKDALKHILALGVTKFSETEAWMHFKNRSGLIISVRRHIRDDFPNLTKFLKVQGTKLVLPKGLAEATETAEIFSAENADNNRVIVKLKPGKLIIRGEGVTGYHFEPKKINYDGDPLTFRISPKMLTAIVQKHNECEITESVLKVNGGKFVYIASLVAAKEKDE